MKRRKAGPTLVPQVHGGAVWSSGVPANRGGPGRPPSELRERLRGSLQHRVQVLEEIADDPAALPSDRVRAIEVMLRYGLGPPPVSPEQAPVPAADPVMLERQLRSALNDPGVREWLQNENPELLRQLAIEAIGQQL